MGNARAMMYTLVFGVGAAELGIGMTYERQVSGSGSIEWMAVCALAQFVIIVVAVLGTGILSEYIAHSS